MSFTATRLQLHRAAQAAAGVGRTLLPPQPDDSHHAFCWSRPHRALVSGLVDGKYRSGLRIRDFTLLSIGANDEILLQLTLRGKSLDDAFAFYGLTRTDDLQIETFDPDDDALARLDTLYDDADAVLHHVMASHEAAGPVRCWPHHFDIATLIALGGERTVGAGFVPGDDQFEEPYWYVTPWPSPKETSRLPALPLGGWNTKGWVGAMLRPAGGRAEAQGFVDAAIEAAIPLAGS